MHDLFLALQSWWLSDAAGPGLLFTVRICSGALALLALSVTLWNALSPNELERTWDADDCQRFKFIAWLKALGCLLATLYFLSAAVFEVERISSPHRLLVNNAWASTFMLSIFIDAVAWRFHYLRKRVLLREQGQDVRVKL